jgi:hypothetical protein
MVALKAGFAAVQNRIEIMARTDASSAPQGEYAAMQADSGSVAHMSLARCSLVSALLIMTCSNIQPAPMPAMEPILHEVVEWLTNEFALPPVEPMPNVVFVSVVSEHYEAAIASVGPDKPLSGNSNVEAFYNSLTRTIYLPHGWNADTPRDVSMLVHEMVHYVQDRTGMRFACAGERERMAFDAQERWLQLAGTDLETEFGIDGFTLILHTNCLF